MNIFLDIATDLLLEVGPTLCCLVKKSTNEVRFLTLKWSNNIEVK
jgi:hypothetical protein